LHLTLQIENIGSEKFFFILLQGKLLLHGLQTFAPLLDFTLHMGWEGCRHLTSRMADGKDA